MPAAAAGLENKAICVEVGADATTISPWRRRFAARRLDGLLDEPRPGPPRKIGDEAMAETIRLPLETTLAGATPWSSRGMARAVGQAPSTIHRIWRAFGLRPHRGETFKLSNDPLFVEKVRDLVGLDLAPPDRALAPGADGPPLWGRPPARKGLMERFWRRAARGRVPGPVRGRDGPQAPTGSADRDLDKSPGSGPSASPGSPRSVAATDPAVALPPSQASAGRLRPTPRSRPARLSAVP